MTPSDALKLLSNATALLKLDRADHIKIQVAINTLEKVLADKDTLPKNAPEVKDSTSTEVSPKEPLDTEDKAMA